MFGSSNHRDNVLGKMISSYLSNQLQFDDHTIHLLFSTNRWEKRFVRR
ncbi:putative dTMP kinase [Helianthus anomalus]